MQCRRNSIPCTALLFLALIQFQRYSCETFVAGGTVSTTTADLNTIREKIMLSARRLFVQNGYYSTSITDIIKHSQTSTGAIYHHFPSKEAIAREINKDAVSEYLHRYKTKVKPKQSFSEKLTAYVAMMFEWTEADPDMVTYLLYARPAEILNEKSTICSSEGVKTISEFLTEGVIQQEISINNYHVAIGLISGTIARLIDLRIDGFIATPLTELAEETANKILSGLKR